MSVETKPAWDELVAHEPRLNDILAECHRRRRDGNAWWTDYQWAKRELAELIGWDVQHASDFLESSEAYEVAVQTIADALGI